MIPIYKIDRHSLNDIQRSSDEISQQLFSSVQHYLTHDLFNCGMCNAPLDGDAVFLVIMPDPKDKNWTSCFCKNCSEDERLQDQLDNIIDMLFPTFQGEIQILALVTVH